MLIFANDKLEIYLQHDFRLWSGRIAGLFNVDWWITSQVISLSFSILCFTLHIDHWKLETETPNEETEAALAESERGEDLHKVDSVEELFKDLESGDEKLKHHSGDCTIYASLIHKDTLPSAGICTCGFGLRQMRKTGDVVDVMYSRELMEKLILERLR